MKEPEAVRRFRSQPDIVGDLSVKVCLPMDRIGQECRRGNGNALQGPVRNTVFVDKVAVACNDHQFGPPLFQVTGDIFRHGLFPDALGLIKIVEGAQFPVTVHVIDPAEKVAMGLVSQVDLPCDGVSLIGVQTAQSLSGDFFDHINGGVDGQDSAAAFLCPEKQGSVKMVIVAPRPLPVNCLQEGLFRNLILQIPVKGILPGALKGLHGNGRWAATGIDRLQNLHLNQMVFGIVVDLAQEDHVL